MIDYKDFVIPEFYWDYFVREKRSLFINSYLKDNNILPSEDMIKNFIYYSHNIYSHFFS